MYGVVISSAVERSANKTHKAKYKRTENIMKTIPYIISIAIAAVGCTKANDDISLTFKVTDPSSSTIAVVCGNDVHEITLDSLGQGHFELTDTDAAYLRLFYGMEQKMVYVEKGDRAGISFPGNDFAGSFEFDGDKAPAVEYLNEIVLTALPDGDYALEFGEFHEKIMSKTADALSLLHARDLKGTGRFEAMEEGRIRYSFGVFPVTFLNRRLRWCGYWNPIS